jgi:hypothetical protein
MIKKKIKKSIIQYIIDSIERERERERDVCTCKGKKRRDVTFFFFFNSVCCLSSTVYCCSDLRDGLKRLCFVAFVNETSCRGTGSWRRKWRRP